MESRREIAPFLGSTRQCELRNFFDRCALIADRPAMRRLFATELSQFLSGWLSHRVRTVWFSLDPPALSWIGRGADLDFGCKNPGASRRDSGFVSALVDAVPSRRKTPFDGERKPNDSFRGQTR